MKAQRFVNVVKAVEPIADLRVTRRYVSAGEPRNGIRSFQIDSANAVRRRLSSCSRRSASARRCFHSVGSVVDGVLG